MAVGKFMLGNIALLMSYKISAKEIARIVAGLGIDPSDNLATVAPDSVNVAAVQLQCKRYQSLSDYIVDMNLYVADAVNRRAQLICFPAFAGMLPLGFLPQFNNMLPGLQMRGADIPEPERILECLTYFSDVLFDAHFHTMSSLAARHRVYIMSGSTVYLESKIPRHRAFLFDDSGGLVGAQDKLVPSRLEHALRIPGASEVRVFDTPFGGVSILTGSDIGHFEIARAAKRLGASILLNPTVLPGAYTPMDTAGGLNLRVQENVVYGVQCTMTGNTQLGATLEAPCAVFAPNELLRSRVKNGLLAQSSGRDEPDILCAKLDLDVLPNIRNPYLHDNNPDLMTQYLDRLY